jgi:hypothetical protein
MWGPPSTGKTTFLAALHVALMRRSKAGWLLIPEDLASERDLVRLTTVLTSGGSFPQATAQIDEYHWSLVKQRKHPLRRTWLTRWWRRLLRLPAAAARVPLDVYDPSGLAAGEMNFGTDLGDRLIRDLANSAGIIFLFDPITEFERGDAFSYTYGVMVQLLRMLGREGRLPHFVAVCITKFDEIRVLGSAEKWNLVDVDKSELEFPRVADEDARTFLENLCRVSRSDTADLVLNMLDQHFYPERVKFFVTSSIGFYLNPMLRPRVFDPEDYQNHVVEIRETASGGTEKTTRIRGAIHPINVIEPILWLTENVARTAAEWTTTE